MRNTSTERVVQVLRVHGPSTQAALARITGLSRATINNIVKKLLEDGSATLQKINLKEALVVLSTAQGAIAAIEISSAQVKGSLFLFDVQKRFEHTLSVEQNSDAATVSPDSVVALLAQLCTRAGISTSQVSAVAVAIQAPIERATGAIVPWVLNRFPLWRGVNLEQVLSEKLGLPVVVDNDANLAALAEWTWGSGRGTNDFMYIMCSEGVGGGLVINGEIYQGGTGIAGEIGHMVLEESGPLCFCGSKGCLHAMISERAILTALNASGHPKSSIADVIHSARQDDAVCQRVLFDAGRRLGRAIANCARLLAPSLVVVGGGLSDAGDLLMRSVESSPEMMNLHSLSEATRVCIAEVKDPVPLGGVIAVLARAGRGISALPDWMKTAV